MKKSPMVKRAEYVQKHIAEPGVLQKNIEVLYRDPHGTMELWGIPYPMRPRQEPWHLAERTDRGWVWLGSPGWWGHYTRKEIRVIQDFLEGVGDWVPSRPGEWTSRETWEAEPPRFKLVSRLPLPGEEWTDHDPDLHYAGFSSVEDATKRLEQGVLRRNWEIYFPDLDTIFRPTEMFWGVVPVTPDWQWDPDQVSLLYTPQEGSTENPETTGEVKRITVSAARKDLAKERFSSDWREPAWLYRRSELSPGVVIYQYKHNSKRRDLDYFRAVVYRGEAADPHWRSKEGTLKDVVAFANRHAQEAAEHILAEA